MKSMHFEGKEGPFSMYIEPMQGMPAPTSLDGETRLDSVQIDDAPASAFGTSAFGSSSESEMKPRCAVSITLEGDLEAIAAGTAVRRLYEKKFTKDVSDALACNPEHIDILACRKGSIVVDFHITCDECENYVEELKRQVMDPSSRLMNGEVTKKTIKVLGEVEYVRERSERTQHQRGICVHSTNVEACEPSEHISLLAFLIDELNLHSLCTRFRLVSRPSTRAYARLLALGSSD